MARRRRPPYEEHQFTRIISGDVDTVRNRICDVLEEFNYVVLGESPIQAKRKQSRSILTATVLEYQGRLTIGLKQISEASTVATFDYAIPYLFTRGDRESLEREADAIIALATAATSHVICSGCGVESTGAVRFCRSCGAPVAGSKLPPELEIMRMTAGASASQQEIIFGLLVTLLTLAVSLPMVLGSDGKAANIGWVFLVTGGLLAFHSLQQGLRRLQRTLNPKSVSAHSQDTDSQRTAFEPQRDALPARPASVTEGTTELIADPSREPVPALVIKDTDPIT